MLNRALLLKELELVSHKLFVDLSDEYSLAQASWQRIVSDPLFAYKLKEITPEFLIPEWNEKLDTIYRVNPQKNPYTVLASDGSQVYPDRHQGTSCFLVNIGTVELHYGSTTHKPVRLHSTPYIYPEESDALSDQEFAISADLVNCRREELEFKDALRESKRIKSQLPPGHPFAFLFDGSLIFWHLESKDQAMKDYFLNAYVALLHQFYQEQIVCAGYISLPKNKELVNLIRVELCNFVLEGCTQLSAVDHIIDTTVCQFFLEPYSRSTLFKSSAKISKYYPPHLMPYFFYLHVGHEIARIEIPAWIAQKEQLIEMLCSIILDQTIKGNGYPVALAESHEQAVIKGPDRDFFYHLITKFGIEQQQRMKLSQKSLKKRGISI